MPSRVDLTIWSFQTEDFNPSLVRRPYVHVANYNTSLLHLERRVFAVRSTGGIGWELQSETVIDMVHDGEIEGFTPTAAHPYLQRLPRYLGPGTRRARIMWDLAAAFTRWGVEN